ncbi:hypothetical protein CZ794_00225 [Psychrobacter sp. JB385]|nr:hypothetical protein CZ794_00225 [Psychrobacter sp. JB385]
MSQINEPVSQIDGRIVNLAFMRHNISTHLSDLIRPPTTSLF